MLINLLGDADEGTTPTPGADENDGNKEGEETPAEETPAADGGNADDTPAA